MRILRSDFCLVCMSGPLFVFVRKLISYARADMHAVLRECRLPLLLQLLLLAAAAAVGLSVHRWRENINSHIMSMYKIEGKLLRTIPYSQCVYSRYKLASGPMPRKPFVLVGRRAMVEFRCVRNDIQINADGPQRNATAATIEKGDAVGR